MKGVPLRDYVERLMDDMQQQIDRRFLSAEQLQIERTTGLNHRLEGMNEFREQLTSQAGTFVRLEAFDQMKEDVTNLKTTTASQSAVDSYRKWVITLVVAVVIEAIPVVINTYHTLSGR